MTVIVQKFGGTSVATADRILAAAQRAVDAQRAGAQVVMVVSARGHKTDELVDLAKDDREAIIGVLAHEIGHVEHDHTLRRLYQAAGVTALVMLVAGDIGQAAEDLLVQGTALLTLSYSREQESDADRYSVNLMHASGRDPMAIVRFLELLRDKLGDRSDSDFFSTHPATVERIEETRRLAQEIADQ